MGHPVRLLIICPSWGRPCGIASYTSRLQGGLRVIGVESDVVTHPDIVRESLRARRYDGVLLQHEYSLYYFNLIQVLRALERVQLPLVVTMHNTDRSGWMDAQHLFLFRTRAWFVVHSRAARDNLLGCKAPPDETRLVIIPMGCPDYRSTFGPREEVRAELGLPTDAFVVGFFGFAAPHKNIPNLIKAVQKLPDVMGYIHASIHPTNPWAVDQIYQECGLPGRQPGRNQFGNVVLVHESLPDERFGRVQNAMDVVALPYERHGNSVSTSMMAYDALASCRPVLTTRAVYFSELKDEVLKVSKADPGILAGAIRYLQDNEEVRHRLVANAARLVKRNSWPRVAERYLEVLRRAGA